MSQPSLFGSGGAGGTATANIDGGSRGNPGPASYGVYINHDGAIVELKQALDVCTNNVAEYNGLLAALRWAVAEGIQTLHVKSDSLLLVQQMKGVFRVKHPGLIPLFEEARGLVRQIGAGKGKVSFEHVRRELNKEADRLANEAMDEAAAS